MTKSNLILNRSSLLWMRSGIPKLGFPPVSAGTEWTICMVNLRAFIQVPGSSSWTHGIRSPAGSFIGKPNQLCVHLLILCERYNKHTYNFKVLWAPLTSQDDCPLCHVWEGCDCETVSVWANGCVYTLDTCTSLPPHHHPQTHTQGSLSVYTAAQNKVRLRVKGWCLL